MKKILFLALLALVSCKQSSQSEMDRFVDDLMGRMTLQEKLGQLNLLPGGDINTGAAIESQVGELAANGQLGGVLNIKGLDKIKALQEVAVEKSRLGIPLIFGQDIIHGGVTVFPIPLAQACSWNMETIEEAARIAAKEASAFGINWTYSPMVDVALDPRWGRIAEGGGEDPYLTGLVGQAMIRGYQGDYGKENVMACVKHFALYGAAEAGRDYNTVDMSRWRMFNQYLPPYKAAMEAHPGSVMSSFNVVDGIPATANHWLITELLREKWGFDGFLVTDYASINEMSTHGLGGQKECSVRALKAGTDMDMCSEAFIKQLEPCLAEGLVTEKEIDEACRRVLEAKYKLGLFEDPYRQIDPKRLETDLYTDAHRKAARNMAAETFVLLKNEGQLLPLQRKGTIALVGPLAHDRSNILGCWSTADEPARYSTLKEAMERCVGDSARVLYAQGSNFCADARLQAACAFNRPVERVDDKQARAEALRIAAQADVIVCAMGEMAEQSGESSSRADLNLPDVQMALLQDLVATGKPVVLLNFAGRPTLMGWEKEHVTAILNVWFGGSETGDAICDVLFGTKSPCGRLTASIPQSMGQIPLYYNRLNTGRPVPDDADGYRQYASNYLEVRNGPLYPFGYGLTYSTISYSDMKVEGNQASVMVANTGSRDAVEVVQLYIHDLAAQTARPVKELKGFQRVALKAGEKRTVAFDITPQMLSYYDAEGNEVIEPGEFDIMIGKSSADCDLLHAPYVLQ